MHIIVPHWDYQEGNLHQVMDSSYTAPLPLQRQVHGTKTQHKRQHVDSYIRQKSTRSARSPQSTDHLQCHMSFLSIRLGVSENRGLPYSHNIVAYIVGSL